MKKIAFLFAMIFLAASVNVFATENNAPSETADINEQLISYLLSDKDFAEDEKITRGRFLEAVVTLISNNVVPNENGPFSDVEADTYLSYCTYFASDIGIISKSTAFNPDEEIEFVDAITMVVRAVGYAQIAENMGGYPYGHRKLAYDIGLTHDVKETQKLNVKNAYALLFNMMNCNLMLIDYEDERTFLNAYDIGEFEGIVNANEFSYLSNSEDSLIEDRILIGINEYVYEDETDYLGCYVKGFYVEENDDKRIIIIFADKYETVKFSGRDVESYEGNILEAEIDGKIKKFKLRKSFDYLLGEKACSSEDFEELLAGEELSVEIIDNDGDDIYDVVKVDKWQYCQIYSIDPIDKIILDKNDQANTIDLSNDECVYHIYKNEEGKIIEISLNDLKPGMLVACSSSGDQLLQKIIVCDEEKTAVIKSVYESEAKIDVEEATLDLGKYAQKHMNVLPGVEYLIVLGVNGEVVVLNQLYPNTQYGWIVKAYMDEMTIEDTYKIKIFNQAGQMVTYTISEKISIDGQKRFQGSLVNSEFVVDFYKTAADEYRFVKFKTNADGEVKNIDIPSAFSGTDPYVKQGSENDDFTLYFDGEYMYKRNGSFVPSFGVSGTTVFAIPEDEEGRGDDDNYKITQPGSVFTNDERYTVKAYDCTESSTPKVLLYFRNVSGTGFLDASLEAMPAVVIKKTVALDPDDNVCTSILVECCGRYHTLYSNEKTEEIMKSLEKGDIIRYETFKDNVVTSITLDYRFRDDTILTGASGGLLEYNKGMVYSYGNGVVNIVKDKHQINGGVSLDDLNCIAFDGSMSISFAYVIVKEDGTVKSISVRPTPNEKLTDYIHGGNLASYAVIRQRYSEGKHMIIYITE